MFAAVLLCLLALTRTGVCSWPFGSDFVYWFWQSAVVVDQWLYIDGGEYYTLDNGLVYSNDLSSTISIDLSQSWTISSVNGLNATKPASMALARRPPLWYDPSSNLVMERGGWAYSDDPSFYLWSFTPDGMGSVAWELNTASSSAQALNPTFGGAFTASSTHFYSLGGADSNTGGSDPTQVSEALEGLTIYNFESGIWRNKSSLPSSQSGFSVQGQGNFMSNFGRAGLLAFLGGDSPPNSTYEYEAGAALVDMSNITIYDVNSDSWYHQTATGAVPPPRSEFCSVGSQPADNSSYEIYVFGGSTNATADVEHANDDGYLDVYILSMPSFRWFKAGAPTAVRRANHFCQVIGQGQMLVIGGRDPSHNASIDEDNFWAGGADPWTRGMNIFDMTNLTWTGDYTANATYASPAPVQHYYANHAKQPTWSDPALAALFVAKPAIPTTSPTSSSQSTTHKSHTGAIVGGIVGGLVFVLLLALLAFFLRSRSRRQHRVAAPGPGRSRDGLLHELQTQAEPKYELEGPALKEMPRGQKGMGVDRDWRDPNAVELPGESMPGTGGEGGAPYSIPRKAL